MSCWPIECSLFQGLQAFMVKLLIFLEGFQRDAEIQYLGRELIG
jgi:hypothetical protein